MSLTQIDLSEINFSGQVIKDSLFKTIKNSNIMIIKCFKLVFSLKGQSKNYGSYILIIFEFIIIIIFFIFYCKNQRKLVQYIDRIIKTKYQYLKMQIQIQNKNKNQIKSSRLEAKKDEDTKLIKFTINLRSNKEEKDKDNFKKILLENEATNKSLTKNNVNPYNKFNNAKQNIKVNAKLEKSKMKSKIKSGQKNSVKKNSSKLKAKTKFNLNNNSLLKIKFSPDKNFPKPNNNLKFKSKSSLNHHKTPQKKLIVDRKALDQNVSSFSKDNFSTAILKYNKNKNLIPNNKDILIKSSKFKVNKNRSKIVKKMFKKIVILQYFIRI